MSCDSVFSKQTPPPLSSMWIATNVAKGDLRKWYIYSRLNFVKMNKKLLLIHKPKLLSFLHYMRQED